MKIFSRVLLVASVLSLVVGAVLFYVTYLSPTVDSRNTDTATSTLHSWAASPHPSVTTSPKESFPDPEYSSLAGVLAVIRIPSIGVTFPVYEGTSDAVLAKGLGHYTGTALPGQLGNFAVAGHDCCRQTGSPFKNLYKLKLNDTVLVDTKQYTFTYSVVDRPLCGNDTTVRPEPDNGQQGTIPYYVTPDRIDVIAPEPCTNASPHGRLVTLTTCYPDISRVSVHGPTPYRLAIWAELRKVETK